MEKFIEKKAKEMCKIANVEFFIYAKDFVRSIIEEVPAKKPIVTEEWYEKKVTTFMFYFINTYLKATQEDKLKMANHFIRSLIEEIPAKKATVSEEFVEKWADKFDGIAQQGLIIDIDLIRQMLKEAGICVA